MNEIKNGASRLLAEAKDLRAQMDKDIADTLAKRRKDSKDSVRKAWESSNS